jgi:hypothetical protein
MKKNTLIIMSFRKTLLEIQLVLYKIYKKKFIKNTYINIYNYAYLFSFSNYLLILYIIFLIYICILQFIILILYMIYILRIYVKLYLLIRFQRGNKHIKIPKIKEI